jgi:cytochrome c oxidase accessory protein FixG
MVELRETRATMNSKIYPQKFKGKYRTIKNCTAAFLLFIYMIGAWIPYQRGFDMPNQAIMIDLPNRKAYLFNIIIWPEELYYLTLILILGALGLFICTSLFGRLWCGYTCPHTTMVDVFTMVETLIQGDRNARIRLDKMPMNREKFLKKSITHGSWLIISFFFGFGWVGYFYDVTLLTDDLLNFSVTQSGLLWLLSLMGATYLFAGFLREKVCTHMCPYGRFQSGLADENTILVTYHNWRGEPRGKEDGHGDCIDCNRCVIACPMGIDIRDGLQMPCIGCGLCIDACNEVMDKMNRQPNLIEYTSINRMTLLKKGIKSTLLTPKLIIYCSVFMIISCFLGYELITKTPLILLVDKINSPLFTLTPDGAIRNSYRLNLINKTLIPQNNLCLSATEDLLINIQMINSQYQNEVCFNLQPGEEINSQLFAKLPYNKVDSSKYKNIQFQIQNQNIITTTKSIFYLNK